MREVFFIAPHLGQGSIVLLKLDVTAFQHLLEVGPRVPQLLKTADDFDKVIAHQKLPLTALALFLEEMEALNFIAGVRL